MRWQTSHESPLILTGQLVLPNAEDSPAAEAERAGDEPVAGLVAGNLLAPKFRILPRLGGVDRTTVPEAAVDEDGEFLRGKDEVRFAEHRPVPLLEKPSVVRFYNSVFSAVVSEFHISDGHSSFKVSEELIQCSLGLRHGIKSSRFDFFLGFVGPTSVVPSIEISKFDFKFHR